MSLPIPKLDDRNFEDLMKEARSLIPAYNKEWTNYNPSDPGITILEFFAWVVEMMIFRIDQVHEENYHKYLKLLGVEKYVQGTGTIMSEGVRLTGDGTAFTKELDVGDHIEVSGQTRTITGIISDTSLDIDQNFVPELPAGTQFTISYGSIESGICRGLRSISQRYRAITADDYVYLSIECMEAALQKKPGGRAIVVNNIDMELGKSEIKEGHVSVIIIPECSENTDYCKDGMPTDDLKNEIKAYLDARRLITTRVHVVEPRYEDIQLDIRVALKENSVENEIRTKANDIIQKYFDPLKGGQDGKGWPLGRDVYRSEIFHLVEGISGVDHVAKVLIDGLDVNSKEIGEFQLVKLEPINIEVEND